MWPTPTVGMVLGGQNPETGHQGGLRHAVLHPLNSSLAASRANQYRRQGSGKAKKTRGGSGRSSRESFAIYDRDTCSWRTYRGYSLPIKGVPLGRFSETWPPSGTMRNGRAYQRHPLVPRTSAIGSSSWHTLRAIYGEHSGMRDESHLTGQVQRWPTPVARDHRGHGTREGYIRRKAGHRPSLNEEAFHRWPTPSASDSKTHKDDKIRHASLAASVHRQEVGQLNPTWVEWLMGFPPEWTALSPSEMPSSRKSQSTSVRKSSKHGKSHG